jgi:hypothetical protein
MVKLGQSNPTRPARCPKEYVESEDGILPNEALQGNGSNLSDGFTAEHEAAETLVCSELFSQTQFLKMNNQ